MGSGVAFLKVSFPTSILFQFSFIFEAVKHERISAFLLLVAACWLLSSCNAPVSTSSLPILGRSDTVNGELVYPVIPDFSFVNQDSEVVTNKTFDGKLYIADFIFLSCPTICPVMNEQMLAVYQEFSEDDRVCLLSHTVDPRHDSIPRLKKYAEGIGVRTKKWQFVTGEEAIIDTLAERNYFLIAHADSTSPGGYIHSGGLLLVDQHRHIRGVYDGTNPEETNRLIADIRVLLKEEY